MINEINNKIYVLHLKNIEITNQLCELKKNRTNQICLEYATVAILGGIVSMFLSYLHNCNP